jgi:hypothetical protein
MTSGFACFSHERELTMIDFDRKAFAAARKELAALGVILAYDDDWQEFTVVVRGAKAASKYHTDDLQDAIDTGRAMAPAPVTQAGLIAAVRKHASANYERGGWDFLVECWEDEQIAEAIGTARTAAGAIRNVAGDLGLLDERRREVQSFADEG